MILDLRLRLLVTCTILRWTWGFAKCPLPCTCTPDRAKDNVPIMLVCWTWLHYGGMYTYMIGTFSMAPSGTVKKGAKQNATLATGRCINCTGNFTCIIRTSFKRLTNGIQAYRWQRATRLQVSSFLNFYYRQQTKFAKVMFSQASVILYREGVVCLQWRWADYGHYGIRWTSEWYASYWNAFFLYFLNLFYSDYQNVVVFSLGGKPLGRVTRIEFLIY